jgi:hypothetical protein
VILTSLQGANRVAIVPTLVSLFEATFPATERLRAIVEDENGQPDPRRQYLSKYLVLDWREQVLEATDQRRQFLRKIWDDVVRRDLKEMHEAGMDLLVGIEIGRTIDVKKHFSARRPSGSTDCADLKPEAIALVFLSPVKHKRKIAFKS